MNSVPILPGIHQQQTKFTPCLIFYKFSQFIVRILLRNSKHRWRVVYPQKQHGVILIITFLALGVFLLLGTYFLSFTLIESKISKGEEVSTKTYYLAEAGINEAIWRIKNDETTKNNFLNGVLSSADDINKSNVFGDDKAGYAVSFISTAPAEATIIATSTYQYQMEGPKSQRVVRVYITKAEGSGSDWDFAMFSSVKGKEEEGNIEISGSKANITIQDSRLHANNDVKLSGSNGALTINDGVLTAGDEIGITGSGSQIILNNSYQEAPTSTVEMPPVDFDAWAERATITYSGNQFKNLPSGTVLNGIIYVTETTKLSGSDYNLTINGILLTNGSLELSGSNANLTINYDPDYGGGLLVNGNLRVSGSSAGLTVNGLIYISKEFKISGSNVKFMSAGAVIASNIRSSGSDVVANVTYKPEYFQQVLDPELNPDSLIIQINHWEEIY